MTAVLKTPSVVRTAMLDKLAQSLLDENDVKKLKFQPLTSTQVKELSVPVAVPGFLIPYFDLDGKQSKFWRLRYLEDTRKGFEALSGKKPLRYVQPSGGTNEIYLPPYVDWRKLAENTTVPVIITEGELKAACSTKHGLPTIGLGGVYCFRSVKQKESLLPMLREFTWKARQVYICYDSDAVSNPNVVIAENQLARMLTSLGAQVSIVRLPADGDSKIGLDDYLLSHSPEDLKSLLEESEPYTTSAALHSMNELVVYIRNPGLVYDYQNNMRVSCGNFTQHAYANYWHEEVVVTQNGEKFVRKQTATAWIQWRHRAELEAVTFAPGKPKIHERKLNVWNGWPVEPKKGDVSPWYALMAHLFQDTEPAARKWFEQWCAYPLQYPGAKMASAVLFWGNVHGSGKTIVGHTLMKIYGEYSSEITDAEIEDDRFDWAENLQFVLADDITGSSNRRLANRLKTMVTQQTLKINQKFIPRYTIPDCINYYFTSNDPDAFYLDDGDRRYFIHEVVAGKLPKELRMEYVAWRESKEGIAALFHYLLNLDLSDFDPQADAYSTKAKEEMKQLTKSDIGAWISSLKVNADKMLKLPGDLFTAAELLMLYDPNKGTKVTVNGVARELKKAGFRHPLASATTPTKFGAVRLYVVRNQEQWLSKKPTIKQVAEHYENSREHDPANKQKKF